MDLRPGFRAPWKGNPQQGTLFHARASELDPTDSRMPRGYTPARQREVSEAMGEVSYTAANRAALLDDRVETVGSQLHGYIPPDARRDLGKGTAVMRDALSRSDVTSEQISRVNEFTIGPNIGMNGVWMPREERLIFGYSDPEAAAHREGFGTGNPTPESQRLGQGQTVIHELGHANDPRLDPARRITNNARSTMESQGSSLGAAEEFADDFAAQHFRHDPRAGRRETFDVATASYPGSNPDVAPPAHLAGYSSWAERSERAVDDLQPRWSAATERGERYPKTSRQEDHALVLAAERAEKGNRPHQMRLV